jgi:hypothetical protein
MQETIDSVYNKAKLKPKITVVIVNKRISQRFFMDGAQGRFQNPLTGTVIDSVLVEKEDSDFLFDFYLIPQ